MNKSHLKLQFDRLKRHYLLAKEKKDKIAFLDLSHCLRIWVELKKDLDYLVSEEKYILKLPNKINNGKLKAILKGSIFFDVPLASVQSDFTPDIPVKGLRYVNRALSDEEMRKIYDMGPPRDSVKDITFSEWLGSEIISTSDPNDKKYIGISREMIIKRVANLLGASHPEGTDKASEFENKFDPYIRALSAIEVANGYPLTHYQLIEIAQTMINAFEELFKEKEKGGV